MNPSNKNSDNQTNEFDMLTSISPDNDIIELDDTPSGKEEEEYFEDPENKKLHLENQSLEQDIIERKAFADRAYGITQTWIGFLIVITLAQVVMGKSDKYGLTETEFGIVFTTTTASVFGFWIIVGRYLFGNGNKK